MANSRRQIDATCITTFKQPKASRTVNARFLLGEFKFSLPCSFDSVQELVSVRAAKGWPAFTAGNEPVNLTYLPCLCAIAGSTQELRLAGHGSLMISADAIKLRRRSVLSEADPMAILRFQICRSQSCHLHRNIMRNWKGPAQTVGSIASRMSQPDSTMPDRSFVHAAIIRMHIPVFTKRKSAIAKSSFAIVCLSLKAHCSHIPGASIIRLQVLMAVSFKGSEFSSSLSNINVTIQYMTVPFLQ